MIGGQNDLDISLFAFKGPKEQPLKLSVPLVLRDSGDSTTTACTAVLEATITAKVIEVSSAALYSA